MSVITEPRLQAASSTMYICKALLYSPSRKRPDCHVDTKCNISLDQASPESDCMASPDSDGAASPDSISPPLSSSPPTSPPHVFYSISPTSKPSGDSSASVALKRRVIEGQTQMHNRFHPYNRRVAPPL
ncbi:hypothetical protein BS17DRAFT_822179 [Gyrodon lividus]|nr:hypothetical protein BS17DRAFT_822179 [Gyrodon lividus]